MREPPFWWRPAGLEARLLAPAAAIYGAIAARRLRRPGQSMGVPVVCIGNPTLGGAGKTPLALAVARLLAGADERPVFLSRGYGGRLAGPVRVDPDRHRAADVGDEPILLACAAPAIVARDRVQGALAAIAAGASVIVMDDGFQNPSLIKDVAVLVVDARRAIGNAKVFPAGPLRAPLADQLMRAHAVVLVGQADQEPNIARDARARKIPIFHARLQPDRDTVAGLLGTGVLAFAGIGDPRKFFDSLEEVGIAVAAARAFPDHHPYTPADGRMLCELAVRQNLVLVTTEKDAARLHREPALAELRARVRVLPASLVLAEDAAFKALLIERLAAARGREANSPPVHQGL
jgi:tetraacyldisaccharide 4'-kinase